MLENLFSSKVLFSILSFLFTDQNRVFSTPEIIKATGKKQANVSRELEKLVYWGIVTKSKKAQQNYYQVNKGYSHYNALGHFFAEQEKSNKKYLLYVEEGGASFLSLHYIIGGFAADHAVKAGILSLVPKMISHFKDNYVKFYFEESDIKRLTEESLKKLSTDASFVEEKIEPTTLMAGERALAIYRQLQKGNFKVKATQAVDLLREFREIVAKHCTYGMIAVFDLRTYVYSNYIKDYLSKKVKGTDIKLHYALEKLLAPGQLTMTQLLRIDLLNLAIKSKRSKNKSWIEELRQLANEWGWLNFGYRGPGLEWSYFEETFKELLDKSRNQLVKELGELKNYEKNIENERARLFKNLKIDKRHEQFIRALALLSYLKIYRKDIAFLIIYLTYKILDNFNSLGIKKRNLFYLTLDEAEALIQNKLKVKTSELLEREKECVYLSNSSTMLVGDRARKYLSTLDLQDEEVAGDSELNMLEGTMACLGKTGDWVYGKVKIVNSPADIAKMEEGDILLSVATTPDILPAMKKAAAIVTDQGGITCHAAIVSRELNVPCLIGTRYATKVFKDGDKVVVCPRHGYIRFQ